MRLFIIAFLLDFAIRLFINPKYAPTFMLGQWIVRKQQPEYVGAPQKRFARAIGFAPHVKSRRLPGPKVLSYHYWGETVASKAAS